MKKTFIATYAVLVTMSLFFIFYAIPKYTRSIPADGVEPDLLPLALCWLLLFLSGLMLIKTLLNKDDGQPSPLQGGQLLTVGRNTVALMLVMPLMHYLGFILGGIISMIMLQLSVGQRNVISIGVVSITVPVGTYWIIWHILHVPLP